MLITPRAIQELPHELKHSKQPRLRAWAALQRIRAIVAERSDLSIDDSVLKELADAARRLDKASLAIKATLLRRTKRYSERWIWRPVSSEVD
jgi:hypothetical protein